MARKKSVQSAQKQDSTLVKVLCFPFFLIIFTVIQVWNLFCWLYKWLVKIPDFSSPLLGAFRLVFWGSILWALQNNSVEAWPYVALDEQWSELTSEYPVIFGILIMGFMVINLIVQLFVTCGFSYNATASERSLIAGAVNHSAKWQPQPYYPGEHLASGLEFFDQMLRQQSDRGKVQMMSDFYGGKLGKK